MTASLPSVLQVAIASASASASASAVGGALRFAAGQAALRWVPSVAPGGLPYGTLAVDAGGSLPMGLPTGWLMRTGPQNSGWGTSLGIGALWLGLAVTPSLA